MRHELESIDIIIEYREKVEKVANGNDGGKEFAVDEIDYVGLVIGANRICPEINFAILIEILRKFRLVFCLVFVLPSLPSLPLPQFLYLLSPPPFDVTCINYKLQ